MGLSCEIGAVWQRWRKQARVFGDVLSILRQKKNPFLTVLAPNHSVTCNTQSLTPGRWNKARGCHKISHQSGLSLPRKDALGSPYGTASSPPTPPHTAGPTPEAAWGYLGKEGRKKKLCRDLQLALPPSRIQTQTTGDRVSVLSLCSLLSQILQHIQGSSKPECFFHPRLQILNLCSRRRLQAERGSIKKSRFSSFFHCCKPNNPGSLCT